MQKPQSGLNNDKGVLFNLPFPLRPVTVLDYIGDRDLVNRAVEVNLTGDEAEIEQYEIPLVDATNG